MTATSHTAADAPGNDVGVLMPVVVHFDDLDPMGLLHNGHYQVLVERAWGWFWRGKGLGGRSGLEGDGFNVAKTFDITYDRPIAEIGEYAVHLWMRRLGTTSATAGYRVCSVDGKTTYAHGSRTVVRLDSATMRPAPWSGQVSEIARTLGLPEASTTMLDEPTNLWLRGLLDRHEAVAGTVHVVRDDLLHITAAHNIPPRVQEITARIPLGKGMAGLAWEQDRPIQTRNLKEDDSDAVKPGAKAVDGKAAVALPVRGADGAVRAVVGLTWRDERELTEGELAKLDAEAESLPGTEAFVPQPRQSND